MKLIIHDLSEQDAATIEALNAPDVTVVNPHGKILPCLGCFDCWVKTPGKCIIQKDGYGDMGELLGKCDELTIITECRYGSFSPFVKNILDRSLGYLHPYFTIAHRGMLHRKRYPKVLNAKVFYYAKDITPDENETFNKIISMIAPNFNLNSDCIRYVESLDELKGILR